LFSKKKTSAIDYLLNNDPSCCPGLAEYIYAKTIKREV
jgi:hypothetical protein